MISSTQSPVLEHTGLTSIDMLCHDASNNLCPSNRLEIPALPLHGNNFKNGVKFSVQTTSRGKVPCNKCKFDCIDSLWSPAGSKDITGLVVRVESMKFRDAQKRPDNAFVKVNHSLSALNILEIILSVNLSTNILLLIGLSIHPSPKLHSSTTFSRTSPRPSSPTLRIPSSQTESQM